MRPEEILADFRVGQNVLSIAGVDYLSARQDVTSI